MTDPLLSVVLVSRSRMKSARAEADEAAAEYRAAVRAAVYRWQEQGLSLRKSAARLGITEGALRDLLRPDGSSRRSVTRKATFDE